MADTAFDEIYSSYFLYVRRFLLRLCKGNELIADDLAQETFFQAYISIHRFEENCRVETWLCSIAQNVFYAFLRKEKKQKRIGQLQAVVEDDGHAIGSERYLEFDVALALKQLPSQTERVLSYRLFHELPYAEISYLLGISESSAKVVFHRGGLNSRKY